MRKEDLSIDITLNPCQFSLDSPFKVVRHPADFFSVLKGGGYGCVCNTTWQKTIWASWLHIYSNDPSLLLKLARLSVKKKRRIKLSSKSYPSLLCSCMKLPKDWTVTLQIFCCLIGILQWHTRNPYSWFYHTYLTWKRNLLLLKHRTPRIRT